MTIRAILIVMVELSSCGIGVILTRLYYKNKFASLVRCRRRSIFDNFQTRNLEDENVETPRVDRYSDTGYFSFSQEKHGL